MLTTTPARFSDGGLAGFDVEVVGVVVEVLGAVPLEVDPPAPLAEAELEGDVPEPDGMLAPPPEPPPLETEPLVELLVEVDPLSAELPVAAGEAETGFGCCGSPEITAMICPACAAALDPPAIGPIATPISTPVASSAVATTAPDRASGTLTNPVRPKARIVSARRSPASERPSAAGLGVADSGCGSCARRAPQVTQYR
jgi:hypothetical protein